MPQIYLPWKHRMRNTKAVYNRRFLGSCSVKSHRYVSVHTINIPYRITAKCIIQIKYCQASTEYCLQHTLGRIIWMHRLQYMFLENATDLDDLSLKMMQRTSSYATENDAMDFLEIRVTTQRTNNIHYENTPIQIFRKFHPQKLKIFRQQTLIFFISMLKT